MAKKQLNKNLVISLTIFCFVMVLVVSVLAFSRLKQRDPKYFVELAKQYEAKEDWRSAAVFYQKAWERSQNAQHLVSFGDAVLNDGEVQAALQSWATALITDPTLTDAHLRQIEIALEMARLSRRTNDWDRVAEAATTFLESSAKRDAPQEAFARNANGLALLAVAVRDSQSRASGEEELRRAVGLAGDNVDYALDLAAHDYTADRKKEGSRRFEALLKEYDGEGASAAKIRVRYAKLQAAGGKFDEADRLFVEAVAAARKDSAALLEARLAYAVFLSQQWARAFSSSPTEPATVALLEKAEGLLKENVSFDPESYDAYLQLAVIYSSSSRPEEAVDICEARLAKGLTRKGVRASRDRLSSFMLMIYASDACVTKSQRLRDEQDSAGRETWLVRAEQYLAGARGEVPAHPRVFGQAGRIKLARGLDRQALEDLRAADDGYRAFAVNWDTKFMLASVHLKLGEAGAAKAVLAEVREEVKALPASAALRYFLLFSQALLASNEDAQAQVVAEQALRLSPGNTTALRIKASVLERQNRPAEAAKIVAIVGTDRVIRALLESRGQAMEGNTEGALAVLREALALDPADPRLVSAAVRLLVGLDRRDEAQRVLDDAIDVAPDALRLKALAVLTRVDLTPEQRDQEIIEIIASEEDAYQRAVEFIGFYLRKNEPAKTLEYVDEALTHLAAKASPAARGATVMQHRALLVTKMTLAAKLDDGDALASARDEAAKHNVDGAGGKGLLGLYHMHLEEYDLAIRALREAIEAQPTDARSQTHLGQCLHLQGQYEEADAYYLNAIGLNPNDGLAHRSRATLAKAQGKMAIYEASLIECERLIPADSWVRGEVLARREKADPARAIAARRALLAEEPKNTDNLKRLVDLSVVSGDVAAAGEYYETLLQLLPDDASVVMIAAEFFRRERDPQRGLALLTNYASTRLTPEARANAQISVASHHLLEDNPEAAEAALLAGAKQAQTLEVTANLAQFYLHNVNRPDQAAAWMDKAVETARAAKSPRLSTMLGLRIQCALRPEINDLLAAKRDVDELLGSFPEFLKGFLLAAEVHARAGRIKEAVDAVTEFLRHKPDDTYARYQLALHAIARGRFDDAVVALQQLKRADQMALNLEPRFLLARLHRQADRKQNWIRELESLMQDAPNSARAMEALVQAYVEENRVADAERLVTVWINRIAGVPQAPWLFLRSRIASQVGDERKALDDVQHGARVLKHSAEGVSKVLATFGMFGRFNQGIEYYDRYGASVVPNSSLLSNYARLLFGAGQEEAAAEQFRRAVGLAVDQSAFSLAGVMGDLRSTFPRGEVASSAIALFENQGASSADRASDRILVALYRVEERLPDAVSKLRSLIVGTDRQAERASLLEALGNLYQESGEAELARENYLEALKYPPENWVLLNNLAYLLSDMLGDHVAARGYAERAVAHSANAPTLDTLGWILVGLGNYQQAIATLHRAVRMNPGHEIAFYHLGEAYRRDGQFDEAGSVLGSGRAIAMAAGESEMILRYDESLAKAVEDDKAP